MPPASSGLRETRALVDARVVRPSGSEVGPWPFVRIDGDLERAEREWLHTNGTGAYAMSTLALMHTRRHHGIFAAVLESNSRYVVLSHAETTVEVGDRVYRLSTHQFPGVAPTPGYRRLSFFAQDPIPRWEFRLGSSRLERTLSLVRGHNAVVLGYRWSGPVTARLTVKPLMPLRPVDELMREHGGMMQRVTLRPGEVIIRPVQALPDISFRHCGVFVGSPDWWRRFEYLNDRREYSELEEDLWSPGVFELSLEPGRWEFLTVSVGEPPVGEAQALVDATVLALMAEDPGPSAAMSKRRLVLAAEQFCVPEGPGGPELISGFPWGASRTKTELFCLPGLLLSRGKADVAQRWLVTRLREDFLEKRTSDGAAKAVRNDASCRGDAALWFFDVVGECFRMNAGRTDPAFRELIYPEVSKLFLRIIQGDWEGLWLAESGLIASSAATGNAVKFSAGSAEVLERDESGLAVDHQALWSRACLCVQKLARAFGDTELGQVASRRLSDLRRGFSEHFWCLEADYPFDSLSVVRHGLGAWSEPAVGARAVIALALDPELFEDWQRAAILERARNDLLTPVGVRTLCADETRYVGHVAAESSDEIAVLRQGVVWSHLLSFYVRAQMHQGADRAFVTEVHEMLHRLLTQQVVVGQITQLAEGDSPHRGRGMPADALGVARLLDMMTNVIDD